MDTNLLEQHKWLEQLLGDWSYQHESNMPDGSIWNASGTMKCYSLHGMWLVWESGGEFPDGKPWSSIMTIGFDPSLNQFVGSFVGSMMSNIWNYSGVMDKDGRLPLMTEGPNLNGDGNCRYRDTIEIVDTDCWLYGTEIESEPGKWSQLHNATHRRV